jgi:hypothetical protein
MRGLKGGGLLLILAVPLALYVAWQAGGVVRTDLVAEPPPDRGATREQLEAVHKRASAWADEVQKAVAFEEQFLGTGAGNDCSDADAKAVVKAATARANELKDLDLFLSGVERPTFQGKKKEQYTRWMTEGEEGKRLARDIVTWLSKPPVLVAPEDAKKQMGAVLELIGSYSHSSNFSDKSKAHKWRVQARLQIIAALKKLADDRYGEAVKAKLPLAPGDNAAKSAVDTLRALKDQLDALATDLRLADEEKVTIDGPTHAEAQGKGSVADECVAREELLGAFAREDLFTNPTGADKWLKDVTGLYRRTKDSRVRAVIREKVQEFCEAFVPAAVRLDDKVLIKGKEEPRKEVVVEYEPEPGAVLKSVLLSDEENGLNEYKVKRYPDKSTELRKGGAFLGHPRDLEPTRLSEAARKYNLERKKLADSITVPKWSAKSVEELKNKCVAEMDLVNQLQTPEDRSPKIWTRLSGLAVAMVGCADLFENGP